MLLDQTDQILVMGIVFYSRIFHHVGLWDHVMSLLLSLIILVTMSKPGTLPGGFEIVSAKGLPRNTSLTFVHLKTTTQHMAELERVFSSHVSLKQGKTRTTVNTLTPESKPNMTRFLIVAASCHIVQF